MADARGLIDYIWASPSPFHCVDETVRRLEAAGFRGVDDRAAPEPVTPGSRRYLARGGTVIAWLAGAEAPAEAGFRMLGAHTDSPNLRIKPNPEYVKEGYVQWAVEPYGGVIYATWADRDLGLSGRVAVRTTAGVEMRLLRVDRPLARVANVAIHLNREVNKTGLLLNAQTHLPPLIGLESDSDALMTLIAEQLQCEPSDVVGFDLGLHDVQPPALGGIADEFIFAPRLDNQASCYTAIEALLALDEVPAHTSVVSLYDHEECGSGSERGAGSTLTRNVLNHLTVHHTSQAPGGVERALANSFLVSADMAHAIHPNYADKHEPQHRPSLNGGPVVKTNVNMRYATDAGTAARFRAACADENAPVQEFVTRSDLACGSTIGAISAAGLAVRTVDVGCAMLSMHSIREQAGTHDVDMMTRVMGRLLREG